MYTTPQNDVTAVIGSKLSEDAIKTACINLAQETIDKKDFGSITSTCELLVISERECHAVVKLTIK
jgi:hypothetical protein